ncbi:hypothetical protein H5407_04415 [Mitsuaria sp. WAJ17]|uniref:hypothetical protein n=1 Tax=Mitsuaria sp. WAJ17 TaxID=2761452 RepID=UPI00160143A6|nr:hypothetical protein [Mitsuaria sp. WAJ17]MBB2484466.1 hypothetical protein [Mitsuaria sp. WAJ17]
MRLRVRMLGGLMMAGLAGTSLTACQKKLEPSQFVGRWKSSRLSTPLLMRDNGEWEIRSREDAVLQYGVWRLEGQRLVWTLRDAHGRVTHDANDILSVEPRRFVLAERDGGRTSFDRLD